MISVDVKKIVTIAVICVLVFLVLLLVFKSVWKVALIVALVDAVILIGAQTIWGRLTTFVALIGRVAGFIKAQTPIIKRWGNTPLPHL